MPLIMSLLIAAPNICFTDTAKADFDLGVLTSVSTASDGNVQLQNLQAVDQADMPPPGGSGYQLQSNAHLGQTFTAGVSGPLVFVSTILRCFACGNTAGADIRVGIRAASGGLPTGPELAVATIPGFSDSISKTRTATFATPMNVVAGSTYAIYWQTSVTQNGWYELTRDDNVSYAGGNCFHAENGAAWSTPCSPANDISFQTVVGYPFATSGNFVSQVRQIDPLLSWSTMTWGRALPAGTSVTLQVAASASPSGPFNYVVPNGASSTSASLAQFAGQPYLRYRAVFSSTDHDVTPFLSDVTLCYSTLTTSTSAPSVSVTYPSTVPLEATLSGPSGPVAGRTVSFTISGAFAGSGTTDVAGIAHVDVSNVDAGTTTFLATFAGDAVYDASTMAAALTVAKAAQVIQLELRSTASPASASLLLAATGGASGNPVVLSSSTPNICVVTADMLMFLSGGTCTVHASQAGNANYADAAEVVRTIELEKTPQTISFDALTDFVWSGGAATLAASSSSGLPVAFSVVSGPCTIAGTAVVSDHGGACVIAATQPGDDNFAAATTQTQSVTVGKVTPGAIDFAPLADVSGDAAPFQLSATGGGASTPVTFSTASAGCSLLDRVVIVGAAGTCTIDANQAADSDYEAAAQVSQSFEVLTDPSASGQSAESRTGCRCNNGSPDASSFLLLALVIARMRRKRGRAMH